MELSVEFCNKVTQLKEVAVLCQPGRKEVMLDGEIFPSTKAAEKHAGVRRGGFASPISRKTSLYRPMTGIKKYYINYNGAIPSITTAWR